MCHYETLKHAADTSYLPSEKNLKKEHNFSSLPPLSEFSVLGHLGLQDIFQMVINK